MNKCPVCEAGVDVLDDEFIGGYHYQAYICKDIDCMEVIEKLDGKIIGEDCDLIFWPINKNKEG